MVLAAIWEKRNRRRHIAQGFEQGKTVGRDEGREEVHNDWSDWLQRRDDAAANGLPFDEPRPDANGHRNGSRSNSE